MGVFSALFGPPAPTSPSPEMRLLRYFCETSVPPTDYTVLDLETSGLDACTCEILEIGAIRYKNHRAVGQYHTFVRPEGFIPRDASRVNHITWGTVCKAPYFFEVSGRLIEFLGNDVIVGFNVSFDMRFLQTRLGKGIKNPAFDVLSFVKEAEPNLPHYKLGDLRRHFHVGGVPHTALGDCMATAEIFQKCLVTPEGIRFREQALEMQSINDQEAEVERERYQRIMDRKNEQPKKPSIEVPLYYMPDHDDQGNEISDTWFVDVSGISHIHNGCDPRKIIPTLKNGEYLFLMPDLNNRYDDTAIRVVTLRGQQIGWYPSKGPNIDNLYRRLTKKRTVHCHVFNCEYTNSGFLRCIIKIIVYSTEFDKSPAEKEREQRRGQFDCIESAILAENRHYVGLKQSYFKAINKMLSGMNRNTKYLRCVEAGINLEFLFFTYAFAEIKQTARLCYCLIPITFELFADARSKNLNVQPASKAEGAEYCRLPIKSPDDLLQYADLILASYDSAYDRFRQEYGDLVDLEQTD